MISPQNQAIRTKGATLVEATISLGVLAVAVPLVFGAIFQAGRSGIDSELDNRSTAIIPACLAAVERARVGSPGWFDPSPSGTIFPANGDVWALAFSEDGRVLGRLTKTEYEQGLKQKEGEPVRYLASLSAAPQTANPPPDSPLRLTITIEQPAIATAKRRSQIEFHSSVR